MYSKARTKRLSPVEKRPPKFVWTPWGWLYHYPPAVVSRTKTHLYIRWNGELTTLALHTDMSNFPQQIQDMYQEGETFYRRHSCQNLSVL